MVIVELDKKSKINLQSGRDLNVTDQEMFSYLSNVLQILLWHL